MPARYETPSGMRRRGWTATLIARHLGEPDELGENPHSRGAPPMRLYRKDRIKQVEQKPVIAEALQEVLDNRQSRSTAAKKGLETRRKSLLEWAETAPLEWYEWTPKSIQEARRRATEAWESHQMDLGRRKTNGQSASAETKLRWTENYLRHECLNYEAAIAELRGEVSRIEAYALLRGRADDMIDDWFRTRKDEGC